MMRAAANRPRCMTPASDDSRETHLHGLLDRFLQEVPDGGGSDLKLWATSQPDLAGRAEEVDRMIALLAELRRAELLAAGDASGPGTASSQTGEFGGDLSPGEVLGGRYRIVAMVGEGGMGQVYLADDLVLGESVALKLLPADMAQRPGVLERFFTEVRLAREVSHPSVARVHDIAEFDGRYLLSMEFVDGETLSSLMRRIGYLPREKATQIAVDLCSALAEVHRKGILHRDLKPANIMLDGEGRVRLTDFGLAVAVGGAASAGIAGTPAYMAPEQLRGAEASLASEVYALGLVMVELYTGTRAVQGRTLEELSRSHEAGEPQALCSRLMAVAPRVASILSRCLALEVGARPGLEEVLATLGSEQAGSPLSDPELKVEHSPPSRTNLSASSPELVGREAELALLEEHLAGSGVVTLAGPGGVGKTSLAVAAGERALAGYPGGAWMIDLAGLNEASLIPQHAASKLEVPLDGATQPLKALVAHLARRRTLVLLDNCEHLIEAAADLVVALLEGAPETTVLATSQEPLGVRDEVLVRLGPLELPDSEAGLTAEALGACASVQLFVRHARAAHASFELTDGNGGAVVEICRRLDGIPLAIKLAAARAGTLSLQEIGSRLDRRFQLLGGGRRGEPERHRTLRGALDWSHDLLTPTEQQVFRRLAIFPGSFSLAAVEAIVWAEDEDPWARLDDFTRLVERSLVVVNHQPSGVVRYRLLETVRAYAGERLATSGEQDQLRRMHRRHFTGHARELLEGGGAQNRAEAHARLDEEVENLRLALDPAGSTALAETMELAGVLEDYWKAAGLATEALHHLERLLANDCPESLWELRAKLLFIAGKHAQILGRLEQADGWMKQYHEEAEARGNRRQLAKALSGMGNIANVRGDSDEAERLYKESLEISRELDDRLQMAVGMGNLGVVAKEKGRAEEAIGRFEECLPIFRELGNTFSVGVCLNNISACLLMLGRTELSAEYSRRALAVREEIDDRVGIATCYQNLGILELRLGNLKAAGDNAMKGLSMRLEMGTMEAVPGCLEGISEYMSASGRLELAVRALGAADRLRSEIGAPLAADLVEFQESFRARLAESLGEARFRSCLAAGEQASIEELARELFEVHAEV